MVRVAVALLMLLLPSAAWAQGEKRIALLIGNQNYADTVGALKNPHNDIATVGKALESVGFKVTPVREASRRQVLSTVKAFAAQLAIAGPNAVGFFYYSGHGVSRPDDRANYLIPVDLKGTDSADFWFDAVKLDDILSELERVAPNAAHFIVFDACRNELKLPDKSAVKGFEPVAERNGMFIAFATGLGAVASDRGEKSGPYAGALAAELMRPGQDHLQLFQNVKEGVFASSGRRQVPWERNGLLRRVHFGGDEKAAKPAQPVAPTVAPQLSGNEAAQAWAAAKESTDTQILEAFIKYYGDTFYGAMARSRLEELKKQKMAASPLPKPAPTASWNSPDAVRQALYQTIMNSRSATYIEAYRTDYRRPKALVVCVDWGTTSPTALNGGQDQWRWRASGDGGCRGMSARECVRRVREICEEKGVCKARGQKCLVVDINEKNAIVLDDVWVKQFVR